MFKRILIANRGEIALRVQRTCRELGIETVAVYSDADRNALHVRNADVAVHIGPGPALESYLSIDKIIAAARSTGAEAIHPGYGFLSENARFADAAEAAGIAFIGPPASAMRAMGDKVSARRLMEAAGVPVVPGANDIDVNDVETASREAERIGFPLLVKASAGGGGRGIRLVRKADELETAMRASGAEAASTFGDARIFLERYVSPARHIEVQIMADAHGNVRAFGERECSIQRRNQKLLEEAPSVAVTPGLRERLCAAAIAAARSCGYRNAGTVEFLVDPDGHFYFLEVNARLQVEHPVTELVYGTDLVALQLAIAAGEPLAEPAGPLEPRGWAIECRINGEDPYNNFAPSIGLVDFVQMPMGPGVRFDTMLFDGLDIPVYYDSLLGKLIVWAETRELAVLRMRRALDDLIISGVETNVPFHRTLMDNANFRSGDFHTGWLESEFRMPGLPEEDPREQHALIAAAIAASLVAGGPAAAPVTTATRWQRASRSSGVGPRIEGGRAPRMASRHRFQVGERTHTVVVDELDGRLSVVVDEGEPIRVDATTSGVPGLVSMIVDERPIQAYVVRVGAGFRVVVGGRTFEIGMAGGGARQRGAVGGLADPAGKVTAPLAGVVVDVRVAVGESVTKGQSLVVIEAMKMQNEVQVPHPGRITAVHCVKGGRVEKGDVVIEYEVAEE